MAWTEADAAAAELKARQKLELANRELARVRIDGKAERRRAEARGKILVGGHVLALAKAGDRTLMALVEGMMASAEREDDKARIKMALESTKGK